jgi:hypothetical protein
MAIRSSAATPGPGAKVSAERLGAVLDVLSHSTGEKFDAETFESRLRIQKTVYLLQAFRYAPFQAYSFTRYFHGPYCPDLAKDYYALREGRAGPGKMAALPPGALEPIVRAVRKGNGFLEAASTLHHVASKNGTAKEETFRVVRELKPHLGDHTLGEAWQFLVESQLVAAST